MSCSFDSLPWHDAELLELLVDRRAPGERDEVCIRVAWPQGEKATLLFRDCYGLSADMNFGVIAEERIANALVVLDDPGLKSIRERWKLVGVELDLLRCYQIETSSTASFIRIYAKQMDITPSP
jgi:hypothetical protein